MPPRRITIPELAPFLADFVLDVDTRGPNATGLEIILGDEASREMRRLTHTVHRVKGVTVELDENEDEQRLVIEGDDGSQAVVSVG